MLNRHSDAMPPVDRAISPFAFAAARLVDAGWSVIPLMARTKKPGIYTGGSWREMRDWTRFADRPPSEDEIDIWLEWPDANIGHPFACGFVGMDVDTDDPDMLAAIAAVIPPSPVKRRGSKGYLAFYRDPHGVGSRRFKAAGSFVVDILGHGKQTVLPPSVHPDGSVYRWLEGSLDDATPGDLPELPADIVERLTEALAPWRTDEDVAPAPPKPRGVVEPGESIWRDLNDAALRDIAAWFPALGLPKTKRGADGGFRAVAFWRASNNGRPLEQREPNLAVHPDGIRDWGGADKGLTALDVIMRARSCDLEAAVEWLRERLATPAQADSDVQIDVAAILAALERRKAPAATTEYREPEAGVDDALRALLGKVDGLLARTVDHIVAESVVDWPEAALVTALPLLGAAMGRRVATPTNLRSNIYSVMLSGSGWGKSSILSAARGLFLSAGLDSRLGASRIMSDSALVRQISEEPARFYALDEFGHWLQRLSDPKAGGHEKRLFTLLTEMFSAAGGFYSGAAYAAQDMPSIDQPHLCLLGVATRKQFWQAFSSGELEDGTLARYLVFDLRREPSEKDPAGRDDLALCAALQKLATLDAGGGNLAGLTHDGTTAWRPRNIAMTGDAREAWDDIRARARDRARKAEAADRDGAASILRRIAEHVAKVALIHAVGRDPERAIITLADVELGRAVADLATGGMLKDIETNVASTREEATFAQVLGFIREAGRAGRKRRDIFRRFRGLKKRDLDDVLSRLNGADLITEHTENTSGRPAQRYVGAENE